MIKCKYNKLRGIGIILETYPPEFLSLRCNITKVISVSLGPVKESFGTLDTLSYHSQVIHGHLVETF